MLSVLCRTYAARMADQTPIERAETDMKHAEAAVRRMLNATNVEAERALTREALDYLTNTVRTLLEALQALQQRVDALDEE